MNKIYFPKNKLETIGSFSLVGTVAITIPLECHPCTTGKTEELVIEFEQSSKKELRDRPGPDFVLIPEYVIPCLLTDIKSLIEQGWDVKIVFENEGLS